jgi:hypothetical protein
LVLEIIGCFNLLHKSLRDQLTSLDVKECYGLRPSGQEKGIVSMSDEASVSVAKPMGRTEGYNG